MSHSRFWFPLLGLTSFVLSSHLAATTNVTNSEGNDNEGTLSAAINTVNASSDAGPIAINSNVTPTLTTISFSTITTSMTIGSDETGSARTIDGHNVSNGINATSGSTTFTTDIILSNAKMNANKATLVFQGPNNWTNAPSINLENATLSFSYADTQSASQIFAGNVTVDTAASILAPNLKNSSGYNVSPQLLFTGQIIESISGTTVTFGGGGYTTLNNSSSTNNWSGGTVLSGSSLIIQNSNSFPANSNITIPSGVVSFELQSSDTYTSSGDITGDVHYGVLDVTGGTVNLSGPISSLNTIGLYSGNLNISGNISNILGIQIAAGTMNISGNIFGSARFSLSGGTTILSGDNSEFSGGFALGRATLQVSSINNIGKGEIILNGGTLHTTGNLVFGSDLLFQIESSSTLAVDSGFTLTIPILNVIPGDFAPFTLALTGSGDVNIPQFSLTPFLDNISSPTPVYRSIQCDISGILSGTDGFFIINTKLDEKVTNTLSLSGKNTYTGETDIRSYITLEIKSGQIGNLEDPISIATDGTLQIDSGANVYCSTLTNNGSLTGCGTIEIEDIADSYGNLSPTNCSTSSLSSANTVGSFEVPDSPSLTIYGDLVSHSGSTLTINLDPSSAGILNVIGEATLDGDVTLHLAPTPGCYPHQVQFIALNASNGLSGEFSQVVLKTLLLSANVSYTPDHALVTVDHTSLTSLGLTGNAKAVGQVVDQLIDEENTEICQLVQALFFLTDLEIADVLNQAQPALFKGMTIAQENNIVKVQDALSLRMQKQLDSVHCYNQVDKQTCVSQTKPFHVWINGLGDALNQESTTYANSPQVGYHENTYGVITGVDYHFSRYFYAGALGAYTHSQMKWVENQGSGHINSGYGGVYLSAIGDLFYGNASVIGSWNHFKEHRNIFLPVQEYKADNSHGGSQLLSHVDTGLNLGWKWFTIRPFDSFDYITQTENSFRETGADMLNLSVQKSNAILLRNELGLSFAGCFCLRKGQWTISPKISWVREVRIKGSHYTAEFVGTDVPFTVTGYFSNRSLVSPGVNVTGSMLNDLLLVGLYYNGEFKGGYSDHSYGAELRFGF